MAVGKRPLLLVALATAVLAALYAQAMLAAETALQAGRPDEHAVVLDIGSSGTRAYVFGWSSRLGLDRSVQQLGVKKITGGLATASDATRRDRLQQLIDFSRAAIGPTPLRPTLVFAGATAGVRKLGAAKSQAFLSGVQSLLAELCGTDMELRLVSVLTGKAEGLFGWLAVNTIKRRLLPDSLPPDFGMIDLGGSSTQVAMRLDGSASAAVSAKATDMFGWPVLSLSLAGFGLNDAFDSMNRPTADAHSPCMHSGAEIVFGEAAGVTLKGAGDYAACREHVETMMKPMLEGVPADNMPPTLPSNLTVYAVDNYRKLIRIMFGDNVASEPPVSPTLLELHALGTQFCKRPFDEVVAGLPNKDLGFLKRTCFGVAYVHTVLQRVYGVKPDSRQILFLKEDEGFELSWPLGMAVSSLK